MCRNALAERCLVGFEEALELAAEGNAQAAYRLRRAVRTAPDDPQSIRAMEVLTAMQEQQQQQGAKL